MRTSTFIGMYKAWLGTSLNSRNDTMCLLHMHHANQTHHDRLCFQATLIVPSSQFTAFDPPFRLTVSRPFAEPSGLIWKISSMVCLHRAYYGDCRHLCDSVVRVNAGGVWFEFQPLHLEAYRPAFILLIIIVDCLVRHLMYQVLSQAQGIFAVWLRRLIR